MEVPRRIRVDVDHKAWCSLRRPLPDTLALYQSTEFERPVTHGREWGFSAWLPPGAPRIEVGTDEGDEIALGEA